MNIIIVDDEIQTVRAIKHSINWERLHITEVFSAFNISHAKEILIEKKIDLAICDIEMPQGSGIELLQWMKEHSPDTESILLTSHAEFEFAKKAIELGCSDYLVKPIPFEKLEDVIFQVISKIKSRKKLKEYSEYGELWIHNQSIIEEGFWSDLLKGTISESPSVISQDAKKRNVDYKIADQYLLVLISKKRLVTDLGSWNDLLLDYALKNIVREIIAEDLHCNSVFNVEGQLAVILPAVNNKEQYLVKIKKSCEQFISICNQYLRCSVSCYIGNFVFGEQLAEMYKQLLDMDQNNVALTSKIFELNEGKGDEDSQNFVMKSIILDWSIMLRQGKKENLVNEIVSYIHNLGAEERLNVQALSIFQHDMLQMVYSFLEQKEVQAHQLFKDTTSQDLYRKSTGSIDNMSNWIKYFINKAVDYTEEVTKPQSVISKVKEYINKNLSNDISRDDMANFVFLNPDYLARIFKKSTGLSLSEYITEQRIERSISLLIYSDIPISEIALNVGYDSFAYFSSKFKKITNVTPSEYRKKYRKSEIL
ncbi:response regulator [Neobacillus drentensis]|uniref:response regulator transcription factor n=1 Tax=Neobacillus drentensis TaxID=220684 RepID=UPI001F2136C9|nr:response regulator [Neobacillus drentensis]ULT54877.1 response regulator [Neobacillus drentensis]